MRAKLSHGPGAIERVLVDDEQVGDALAHQRRTPPRARPAPRRRSSDVVRWASRWVRARRQPVATRDSADAAASSRLRRASASLFEHRRCDLRSSRSPVHRVPPSSRRAILDRAQVRRRLAVPQGHQLGHHADRDLLGADRTDVEADRREQPLAIQRRRAGAALRVMRCKQPKRLAPAADQADVSAPALRSARSSTSSSSR